MADLTPQEQQTVEAYNALATQWTASHDTSTFWEKELRRFQELLPTGTILEVGSGGARDARELLALGYTYVGTDISPGLIQAAQKALPDQQFFLQRI